MSSNKYNKSKSPKYYVPQTTNDYFLNNVSGAGDPVKLVAAKCFPANPTDDELPDLEPQNKYEEKRTAGQGLTVDAIYALGTEDGAGNQPATVIFGLHIKDSFRKLLFTDVTGNVAEVFTITCLAKASLANNKYFCFDGIDADSPFVDVFYYLWLKLDGAAVDPAPDATRTGIEADISGATSDTDVALIIKNLITALDDFTADVGAGDDDHIVTVTCGTLGAVDDCRDGLNGTTGATGMTIAVSTQGVSTKVLTEGSTLPNFAIHNEHELTSQDIRPDNVGLSQTEYLQEIESGGKMHEERTYLIGHSIAGSDLARPNGPDGLAWEDSEHPYNRIKKNFSFGDITYTFKYNGDTIGCVITAHHLKVAQAIDHKKEDGSDFSTARYITGRSHVVTMTARPTASTLYDVQKLKLHEYAGAITLTVKAQRGDDTNDFITWAYTKLFLLPFDLKTPAPDVYYEEYEIELHNAPANAVTCTIKDELSKRYYGVL